MPVQAHTTESYSIIGAHIHRSDPDNRGLSQHRYKDSWLGVVVILHGWLSISRAGIRLRVRITNGHIYGSEATK